MEMVITIFNAVRSLIKLVKPSCTFSNSITLNTIVISTPFWTLEHYKVRYIPFVSFCVNLVAMAKVSTLFVAVSAIAPKRAINLAVKSP